jgi:hypothetical protein
MSCLVVASLANKLCSCVCTADATLSFTIIDELN